jgi:DNA-binding beta-propeller fold protein YncE
MRFGSGSLAYEPIEGWGNIPAGWDLVEIPAVAVDSRDNVYVFSRSEHPVVVFDRQGNFLRSWGEGVFGRPHGIFIGPDDAVYCVDDFDHTLRKCTPDGKVVMTIGVPWQASDTGYVVGDYLSVKHGGPPFNRPTSVALSPEGDIYVTDGYANARVHKFSADGKLLFSWGQPGSEPGQFRLVHGICVAADGTLFVGDRMNSRLQIFSPQGDFLGQWNDVYQPNDVCLDAAGHLIIAELGYLATLPMSGPVPAPEDAYPRVTVRNQKGEILLRMSSSNPRVPGGFYSPHGLRLDSRGDLYVSEVSKTGAKLRGIDPLGLHIIQKFARVQT